MKNACLASALLLVAIFAEARAGEKGSQELSAYIIAKGSESPNGQYGVAYPRATEAPSVPGQNFVVALKPFRVLKKLPDDGLSASSQRLSLETDWSADSSRAIVTTKHDKWDMIVGSSLVILADGEVVQCVNLLDAINRELEPSFRKTKAEAYNDVLPFILTDSDLGFADKGREVRVKTNACNDPNEARDMGWTAQFRGVWNIAEGKWQSRKLTSQVKKNPMLGQ